MQGTERDRPRTETERRTAQADEQREKERQAAEQRRQRSSAEGRTAGQMYVAVCRIVSGAPDKDRVVIEPETVFDPTVRETALSEEEVQSLLGHGAIRPVDQNEQAPPGGPTGEDSVIGGGGDTVMGARGSPPNSPPDDDRRQESDTITRDEPRGG